MNAENYEMLITNIEMLMRKQGINQARLIEATGIAQSQMSKGLNRNNKGQLTFEQIWKIADYFKVSIDFLVGRKPEPTETESLPAAAVCRQLMQLVESEMVSYKEIEVEEDMYMREYSPDPNDYPYQWRKGKNKYTAFYFSNFINPDTTGLPEPMLDELQYDFRTGGNSNHTNEEINSFFAYFFKFYDLLKKNDLPRDIFDTAISDRLKTMEK